MRKVIARVPAQWLFHAGVVSENAPASKHGALASRRPRKQHAKRHFFTCREIALCACVVAGEDASAPYPSSACFGLSAFLRFEGAVIDRAALRFDLIQAGAG